LNTDDIKKILSERFDVDIKNVIKSQYSYTIIGADEAKEPKDET